MPDAPNSAEAEITLGRKNGMHITPAVMLCKLQQEFPTTNIVIRWNNIELTCKSPLKLASTGIKFQDPVSIYTTGSEAAEVLDRCIAILEAD